MKVRVELFNLAQLPVGRHDINTKGCWRMKIGASAQGAMLIDGQDIGNLAPARDIGLWLEFGGVVIDGKPVMMEQTFVLTILTGSATGFVCREYLDA